MRLKDCHNKTGKDLLLEKRMAGVSKPQIFRKDPHLVQQRQVSDRVARILKGNVANEQRLELLSQLMFLVVSASLDDRLIQRAAAIKFAMVQGGQNANRKKERRKKR